MEKVTGNEAGPRLWLRPQVDHGTPWGVGRGGNRRASDWTVRRDTGRGFADDSAPRTTPERRGAGTRARLIDWTSRRETGRGLVGGPAPNASPPRFTASPRRTRARPLSAHARGSCALFFSPFPSGLQGLLLRTASLSRKQGRRKEESCGREQTLKPSNTPAKQKRESEFLWLRATSAKESLSSFGCAQQVLKFVAMEQRKRPIKLRGSCFPLHGKCKKSEKTHPCSLVHSPALLCTHVPSLAHSCSCLALCTHTHILLSCTLSFAHHFVQY